MNQRPVILCVDDEKSVLSTLKQQLSTDLNEEFEIEIAESADEALEVMEELKEDGLKVAAVISDQIMPGMKGDELLIEIHSTSPEIPKILLTGQASLMAVQNAINHAGLYRYISKPWERNDLTMTVAQAAKSYLQKEKIDHFDQSIRLLKDINDSTRKLSSQINLKELASTYVKTVTEKVDLSVCALAVKTDKKVDLFGFQEKHGEKTELEGLGNEEKQSFIDKIREGFSNDGPQLVNGSIIFPLMTRDVDHGLVYLKGKTPDSLTESQFEMLKILTKQLIVSYETADLYESVQSQKKIIERKNHDIINSLNYAEKIQTSLLPGLDIVQEYFPNFFVWYNPRDIVSGDFYLFRDIGDNLFIICADCTGHGVPGAFITILGRMIIREVIYNQDVNDPAEVLSRLDERILNIFHKDGESEIRDGMDISVVVYNKSSKRFTFSGAKSTIYCVKNNEIIKYKGSKYEIGNYMFKDVKDKFESIDLNLEKGDSLYLFSDGFQDQFGGEGFSKIGPRKFQELILNNTHLPLDEQKAVFENHFKDWKGSNAQTDDLLVMGIRV